MGTGFTWNKPLLVVALPATIPLVIALGISAVLVVVSLLSVVALQDVSLKRSGK